MSEVFILKGNARKTNHVCALWGTPREETKKNSKPKDLGPLVFPSLSDANSFAAESGAKRAGYKAQAVTMDAVRKLIRANGWKWMWTRDGLRFSGMEVPDAGDTRSGPPAASA